MFITVLCINVFYVIEYKKIKIDEKQKYFLFFIFLFTLNENILIKKHCILIKKRIKLKIEI